MITYKGRKNPTIECTELSASHIHIKTSITHMQVLSFFSFSFLTLKGPLNNALHFHILIKATTILSINPSHLQNQSDAFCSGQVKAVPKHDALEQQKKEDAPTIASQEKG